MIAPPWQEAATWRASNRARGICSAAACEAMANSDLVMLTIGEIADRCGISKQAVSKAVRQLIEGGNALTVERDTRERIARVAYAEFAELRAGYANPAKVAASRGDAGMRDVFGGSRGDFPGDGDQDRDADRRSDGHASLTDPKSFEEARRQEKWIDVQRAQVRHAKECGELVDAAALAAALADIGREIQSVVARLPNIADDVLIAGTREGVSGAQAFLRKRAAAMNEEIARKLAAIAEAAPETDEMNRGQYL